MDSESPRPNPYLMWERLQRGWSHPEAADQLRHLMQAHGETQVGVDRNMWHRWETGARKPEPRYRKYLVLLFGKPAIQLGLLTDDELATVRSLLGCHRLDELLLTAFDAKGSDVDRQTFLRKLAALLGVPVLMPLESLLSDDELGLRDRLWAAVDAPRSLDPKTVDAYEAVTSQYRQMYATVPAVRLFRPVAEHAQLGIELLRGSGRTDPRQRLASATAESALLAGRMAFFDMQIPHVAQTCYQAALDATKEAMDHPLAVAVFAHMSFIPGFAGDAAAAQDHLRGARAHAAYGISKTTGAWLGAVEAEIAANNRNPKASLAALGRSEDCLVHLHPEDDPVWLNWFGPGMFDGFKGYCLLHAGKPGDAQLSLKAALAALPVLATRQRAVISADLAATHLADPRPQRCDLDESCRLLAEAVVLLAHADYAIARKRIHGVRRQLAAWEQEHPVRELDELLYASRWAVGALGG